MTGTLLKSVFRGIRKSLGRYLAILAIIALGCGFFSGLKICRDAMVKTGDTYLTELNFYDYRLISSVGLTRDDVEAFRKADGIAAAEGMNSLDAILRFGGEGGTGKVYHLMSLPQEINLPSLTAGRMPEADDECLGDAHLFTEADIGKELTLTDTNPSDTISALSGRTYRLVGLATSPMYLNYERGTSSVGTGSVAGFLYLSRGVFTADYYTEVCLTLSDRAPLFSDAYESTVDAHLEKIKSMLAERAGDRFNRMYPEAEAAANEKLSEAKRQLDEAKAKLDAVDYDALLSKIDSVKTYNQLFPSEEGDKMLAELEGYAEEYRTGLAAWEDGNAEYLAAKASAEEQLRVLRERLDNMGGATTYVLTRNENVGYSCFDNDSAIVEGISMVFPVFFFLLAALICSTTMTRMVTEERTQNGVLKALGFSTGTIMSRYTIYAGSAAVIGSVSGYFIGTLFIPRIIWAVYAIMYDFAPLEFVFSPVLFLISFVVALLCSVGSAWLSCRTSLRETPANLTRPKAPKSGKRIFLEKIPFIWKRMKFLHKVSARNIFRYRKRFFMMVLGVAGCTALLVTGFGIRDSIAGVADDQFGKISVYDLSVSFTKDMTEEELDAFRAALPESVTASIALRQSNWELEADKRIKTANVLISDGDGMDAFFHFTKNGKQVAYPRDGEVLLNEKLADQLGVKVGDRITLRDADRREVLVTVSGVFENYVYNYAVLTPATCADAWGESPAPNSAFLNLAGSADPHAVSVSLMQNNHVAAVTATGDLLERVNSVMSRLDYIVLLVLVCAGALALIVLYNLTNINITERQREIAALKVLGFYRRETSAYVFRENTVLTILGALVGLPLGFALHAFVMSQIQVDLVSFQSYISPLSYLISLVITFAFALAVGFFMQFRIAKINMADSLKSVE